MFLFQWLEMELYLLPENGEAIKREVPKGDT